MAFQLRENDCLKCNKEVRPRQQAIQCDRCDLWQHRTCDTGITQTDYRKAVKGELDLEWTCDVCTRASTQRRHSPLRRFLPSTPPADTTRVVDDIELRWHYREIGGNVKHQRKAEIITGLMWYWIFFHLWYQFDHIVGHYEYPNPAKWTDAELGIPPDNED